MPAVFYNATVQKIHFHIPSDHTVFGNQLTYLHAALRMLPLLVTLAPITVLDSFRGLGAPPV